MGCYFRLTVKYLLYAPSHRQNEAYHAPYGTGWNEQSLMLRQMRKLNPATEALRASILPTELNPTCVRW